jgi:TRAP-type C4-dicarboxylate transport system permease small subunit
MLTRALDRMYWVAGVLAGIFLVAICVIVTGQIVARQLGTIIPSADQFAGFCLAATSFLGLAYSFRRGSHIRVTLFVRMLHGLWGRLVLILALAVASAIILLLAWNTIAMVIQNFSRGEVTSGLVPIALWVPQMGMAAGIALFALALLEDLAHALIGREPAFIQAEADNEVSGADESHSPQPDAP